MFTDFNISKVVIHGRCVCVSLCMCINIYLPRRFCINKSAVTTPQPHIFKELHR